MRSLDSMMEECLAVTSLTTDRHIQISAMMSEAAAYKGIVHYFDCWHVVKCEYDT